MKSIREQYKELLALTQALILQDHTPSERLFASSSDYSYFREYALLKQKSNAASPKATNSVNPSPYSTPQPPPLYNPPTSTTPPPLTQKPTPIPTPDNCNTSAAPITSTPTKRPPLPLPTTKEASPEAKKVPAERGFFTPQKPVEPDAVNLTEMLKLTSERLPGLQLHKEIPDDAEAKKRSRLYQQAVKPTQIVILTFDDDPAHQLLLSNISKAIEALGYTSKCMRASLIEQSQGWDELLNTDILKLVIAESAGIHSLEGLKNRFKEVPKLGKHFLGNIPLQLLTDISFYIKEPSLKAPLWKAIKDLLAGQSPAL